MKCHTKGIIVYTLAASSVFTASGKENGLKLAGVFADHMVLQQQTDASIWGFAEAGETVTVTPSWSRRGEKVKANKEGKWLTTIETPKAGGPFTIEVESGDEKVELKDVLSGEVWICSGQSNMQWKMRGFGVDHFEEDVKKAKHPEIRFCDVPQLLGLEEQDDVQTRWTVCSPNTVLNFSAVAYFFGSQLHEELGVPIGLVSTNWGGSSAEAWMSEEVLQKDFPEFKEPLKKSARLVDDLGSVFPRGKDVPKGLNQRTPAVLYNSMIKPLQPFAMRGVIWYQGESNVKAPEQYQTLFPRLIQSWRADWQQGDFPFYFVQIAPFAYKAEPIPVAFLREAQAMALAEPNTGMVVTMDVGQVDNIHPKDKKPVGERLARLALARDYGKEGLVDSGPMYESFKVEGKKVRLSFKGIGGGLVSRNGEPLSHFTVAKRNGPFVEAQAEIDGETVVVWSDEVSRPADVRFAWGNADEPNLMNKEGLPAAQFRTDDRPIK
ncbi:sialate O-acetylesterase [Roseibacillus persicicus]|uniref:sialate O-acetylesterase n=1 Tax=Roseibacillus persicicus TaxID=454148 RepID=UPI00398BABD6